MSLNKVLLGLILSLIIFPTAANAEIATVGDWIGLFKQSETGNLKSNTYQHCTGLTTQACWVYTSNCTQTVGSSPQISRNGITPNPTPCAFNLSPTPAPGDYYVFRMYANNKESADAVIATSTNPFSFGAAATPTPIPASGKLYRITGHLTINSDITVNETGIIFVDGNLYINTDIKSLPSTSTTTPNAKKGLVFIVKGSIYIKRTVETVNAYLIANGKDNTGADINPPFCSAWDGTTPPASDGTNCVDFQDADNDTLRKKLTINGAVISLNNSISPNFTRRKYVAAGDEPAETINFEPKYLVVLKDIFSSDVKVWREVQ
ncbi:MAG: hypothetical protein PHQ59_00240 [Candidatus Daviesbacteria bacterium]|nr:hypothetical protein [Candidatus Daviesbacteria bacterium]